MTYTPQPLRTFDSIFFALAIGNHIKRKTHSLTPHFEATYLHQLQLYHFWHHS